MKDKYDFDLEENVLFGKINFIAYTRQKPELINNFDIVFDFKYCVNCNK